MAAKAMEGIKVGDTLVIVGPTMHRGHEPPVETHKVAKVGRKWLTMDDCSWNPTTFSIETGQDKANTNYPSVWYRNMLEYGEACARSELAKSAMMPPRGTKRLRSGATNEQLKTFIALRKEVFEGYDDE